MRFTGAVIFLFFPIHLISLHGTTNLGLLAPRQHCRLTICWHIFFIFSGRNPKKKSPSSSGSRQRPTGARERSQGERCSERRRSDLQRRGASKIQRREAPIARFRIQQRGAVKIKDKRQRKDLGPSKKLSTTVHCQRLWFGQTFAISPHMNKLRFRFQWRQDLRSNDEAPVRFRIFKAAPGFRVQQKALHCQFFCFLSSVIPCEDFWSPPHEHWTYCVTSDQF